MSEPGEMKDDDDNGYTNPIDALVVAVILIRRSSNIKSTSDLQRDNANMTN